MTAHVLDLKHLKQGPDFGEVGALEDLATLQRHLAWQTLQFVEPRGLPPKPISFACIPPFAWTPSKNMFAGCWSPALEEKHRFFTQAVGSIRGYSRPASNWESCTFRKEYKFAADWFEIVSLPATCIIARLAFCSV